MTVPICALLQAYVDRQNIQLTLGDDVISSGAAMADTGAMPGLLIGAQKKITDAQLDIDLGFDVVVDDNTLFGYRAEIPTPTSFDQYFFRWSAVVDYLESLPRLGNSISLDELLHLIQQYIEQNESHTWSPA